MGNGDSQSQKPEQQSETLRIMQSIKHCGKLQMLMKLLALWKDDLGVSSSSSSSGCHSAVPQGSSKVLLFSRSVQLLNVIETVLKTRGYSTLRLDGSTPHKHRQQLCDDFNANRSFQVFVISTRAGGVGLNLTG